MRRALRQSVRLRYDFRCGYCSVSETNIGAELTIDHFQPRVHGGEDALANLVYSCHACNEFKGEYWGETDDTRLLHPLRDDLTRHVQEQPDGTLIGISPAGERYI